MPEECRCEQGRVREDEKKRMRVRRVVRERTIKIEREREKEHNVHTAGWRGCT